MSERSGNRGACSQPCRLTYDLVDESGRTVVKGRHLLSVRDLNLSDRIGELIDAGDYLVQDRRTPEGCRIY